ncbi:MULTISPECIES: alpha-L-rhamnosidase [unclassified Niallia]|uniref:alpha-L-rhamnosidase n=1 Tax=unclassified Niallia TaxID=2837522 RepID=UPI001ED9FEBF|nr:MULTISPECIES: alpha-L-rhamnosidase [unclassified Niallia]MDL0434272.1 family 78 glycoside hydrolase catalytic domain [Niallia sp. SS-2023]UPO89024.1 glycoside hydrolase family 78 protein [Niallia sp. Man26]
MTHLKAASLTTEYRTNPLGIDCKKPRLSWKIISDERGTLQQSYQIQVSEHPTFDTLLWNTGIIHSQASLHLPYEGPDLKERTRYFYRVKVWDNKSRESAWSETAWWETALFAEYDWKAQWITPDEEVIDRLSEPAFCLRKEFQLQNDIVSARIYGTGLGLYELYVNGERVGDELFAPGWTSYHKRLQYQTYDITSQLQSGPNAFGIMLADGWYKGNMTWENKRHIYGDRRAAFFELHVRYNDGTEDIIVTDPSWKAALGPVVYSEIYQGEKYDARLEEGFSLPDFDDSSWSLVQEQQMPVGQLIAQENWQTKVTEVIKPIAVFTTPSGETVIDMGQNMVGRIRFFVKADKGTKIILKHAEVLDKDGNIYFGNLRKADQQVEYIAKGIGLENYAPHFSFQGFRYVRVEGYPNQENGLSLEHFVGEVIHTDMEPTGEFECSNPLVNKLQENIKWGQRGNFLDVPTDCPQRDERLGWTGDAQVFIQTALFNYHGGPFFTKWLRDLKAEQHPDGGVPFVIPAVVGGANAAAWGDAATIIPWEVYKAYGDKRLLAEQYDSMKAWVEYMRRQGENEYLWIVGFNFGDWLALDAPSGSYSGATPKDFIATAFYAHSTRILRDAAKVLGKWEDAKSYGLLLENIIEAFNHEFVSKSGRLVSPTQTAHVLALTFDLVDGGVKKRTAHELNELIINNNYHLTTGFVGTPYLCFALSKAGHHETAVKLLLQEGYPSWLYSVKKGATTIWEHWDGIKEDGSFWSDDMNSFNHYAYGAIGDWMYRKVAGLDMDEELPAYKRIRIQPAFAGIHLTYAKAAFESMYGRIQSAWSITADKIELKVEIPANTTAEIVLPFAQTANVSEGGNPLAQANGIYTYKEKDDTVTLTIGSGSYHFQYDNKNGLMVEFTKNSRLIDVLAHQSSAAILDKHAPWIAKPPGIFAMRTKTLQELAEFPEANLTKNQVDALIEELNTIEWKAELVK